jgi:site-specific DNA recombinase
MKQAIELIRVSTESQAAEDRASIPAQRAINRRTALAYGLSIVRSIEISDVSGTAVLMAPEIQELVLLMNDPKIHAVVTREFSRLMRPENFSDYALLQAFADSNTILYLPEGPIDFSSKTGRLMGTIRAAIAGLERSEILERTWSAKEEKRRAGGFPAGRNCLPYGVNFDGQWTYTSDAEKVKEAFRLILAGETSYTTVARRLGLEPHRLRRILRNPIYTGWRVVDYKRDQTATGKYATTNGRQGSRRKIKRAPEEIIRVRVLDPIVSEADFNHVQHILDVKKQSAWRHREGFQHRFTYNGFLMCLCGSKIYTGSRKADYYLCRDRCGGQYMRRDRLDPQLDQVFARKLTSRSFLEATLKASRQRLPNSFDSGRLREQVKSLSTKRQRVLDSYFEGVITLDERNARLATVQRDLRVAEDLLKRGSAPAFDVNVLAAIFRSFRSFDELQRDQKRRLLSAITPQIEVKDYFVKGMSLGICERRSCTASADNEARIYLPLSLAA